MQAHRPAQFGYFATGLAGRPLRRGRKVSVSQWEQALLFRNGILEATLGPGPVRRWRSGYALRIADMRPWVMLLPSQEVPCADGATLKVTVAGQARITDPRLYISAARDVDQALYLAVQVALREVVATTTIEELLASRGEIGGRLLGSLRGMEGLGVAVDQLEMKDIILPSELKKAQTEILVARAQGNAALERARGETAALRSLANAARMAADNPALVQLRLLQQLEASTGHTLIIGGTPFGAAQPQSPAVHTDDPSRRQAGSPQAGGQAQLES